jgi:hypothetical protein
MHWQWLSTNCKCICMHMYIRPDLENNSSLIILLDLLHIKHIYAYAYKYYNLILKLVYSVDFDITRSPAADIDIDRIGPRARACMQHI